MQTFGIGAVSFEIPDFLDARDEDGTLVAYPPGTDFANLRFTVTTVVKNGEPSPGAAERFIRKKASEEHTELHEAEGKVWYTHSQASTGGSPGSTITFWYVGLGARMIVISCFIDSQEGDAAVKQGVLDSILATIRSFRIDESGA